MSSCDKFLAAQFVLNQNVNTVKTRLAFPTIDRNAEIQLKYSREVSMIVLAAVERIDCS